MKVFRLLCVLLLLCGCTPHEVRCDGRLEPVNVPSAAGKP